MSNNNNTLLIEECIELADELNIERFISEVGDLVGRGDMESLYEFKKELSDLVKVKNKKHQCICGKWVTLLEPCCDESDYAND